MHQQEEINKLTQNVKKTNNSIDSINEEALKMVDKELEFINIIESFRVDNTKQKKQNTPCNKKKKLGSNFIKGDEKGFNKMKSSNNIIFS